LKKPHFNIQDDEIPSDEEQIEQTMSVSTTERDLATIREKLSENLELTEKSHRKPGSSPERFGTG
jgi:hypothetical protein